MKVRNWNTLFEKRYIQKDYIPVTIWFGKEVAYSEMFHYRLVDMSSIIEFHFNKNDEALKRFNIINLDRKMVPIMNNDFNLDIFKISSELGSLYCDSVQWENRDNLIGGFVSDITKMSIEIFKDAFKINFKHLTNNDLSEKFHKLSENLYISISETGKIHSVTILNFPDFNNIY